MGKVNLRKWMKACKGSGGIISVIARRLNIERGTVYDYLNREPNWRKYLEEAKEEVLDIAEGHLIKGINEGDKEDIKWYLSRLGRHRGYIANPEIQLNKIDNQQNIQVNIESIRELLKKNEQIWN